MADGVANTLALAVIFTAFNRNRDELGRAFTVTDDGLCQFESNGTYRCTQLAIAGSRRLGKHNA